MTKNIEGLMAIAIKHGNFRFAVGECRARGEHIAADLNGDCADAALNELRAALSSPPAQPSTQVLDAIEVLQRMNLSATEATNATYFLRLLGEAGMWVIANPLAAAPAQPAAPAVAEPDAWLKEAERLADRYAKCDGKDMPKNKAALLSHLRSHPAVADAQRFAWYFSDSPKGDFLMTYLDGMKQGWTADQWRAAIDAAMGAAPSADSGQPQQPEKDHLAAPCAPEITPTSTRFPNKAGDHADTDDILRAELRAAGIPTLQEAEGAPNEFMADLLRRSSGEVKTSVRGTLHGWKFERAWYYWMCSGPGIDVTTAERLHAAHGRTVRVDGHCGCPSPREWFKGLACGSYHVDDAEGLKALADTIRALVAAPSPDAAPVGQEPVALHPRTADLVDRFAAALKEKLAAAEKKYGYSDGWAKTGWLDVCRAKLIEHVHKGDPRDVAAYCAFLWHHGERAALEEQFVYDALGKWPGFAAHPSPDAPSTDALRRSHRELMEVLNQCFDFPLEVFDIGMYETFQMTVVGAHLQAVRAALARAKEVQP
jgi:hypothetical protein